MEWILQVPILFFSIIIHEFSHGWVALMHGDDTAEQAGRLTLNPVPHVDVFGTLLLPTLCVLGGSPVFGWAKPVPVDSRRLRGKKALFKVSVIGPVSNILLAFIAAAAFRLSYTLADSLPELHQTLAESLRFGVILNLYLAAFNLLPVAPLDGSQALSEVLPRRWARVYDQHAPYGFLIILALLFSGVLGRVLYPFDSMGVGILSAIGLWW